MSLELNDDVDLLANLIHRGGIITEHKINNNADLLETLKSQNFKMIKTY